MGTGDVSEEPGAARIWTLADFYLPDAVQVADWYHAVEKLREVAKRLWGEDARQTKAWVKKRETALYDGRMHAVPRALKNRHTAEKPLDSSDFGPEN